MRFRLKETFWQKVKNFFAKIGRFFWQHKIITIILALIIFLFFFVVRMILGPFGFLTGNSFSMAGFFGEKTYLVLLQNENELRPTGGFVTSFAVVKVGFHKPNIAVYDSINVAPPETRVTAPDPIERVFGLDEKYRGWVFHDAGFSPDYKENVKQYLWFLRQDPRFFGTEFDGVVALDIHAISELVDVFGPLQIDDEEITKDNFFQLLQKHSKDFDLHNEEEWENRKNFFGPLAGQLVSQAISSPSRWDDLFETLGEMADEKHFLLYFSDEDIQQKIENQDWAGILPTGDFFMIDIANLGGRKADRFMQRDYWSSFYIDEDGKITEKLTIRISHEGTYNLQSDKYQAYLRIIRPQGTEITASSGDFETAVKKESFDNRTEFGHFFVLMPSESKVFSYEFTLPQKMFFDQPLDFQFVKQAGTLADSFNLVFRGANDTGFDADGCKNIQDTENILKCDFNLDQDKNITITRRADKFPPILQWAEFNDLNHLELRFSEKIAPSLSASDIQVVDLDKANKDNEKIGVEEVKIDNLAVVLTLSGITEQKGEYYRVIIPNLHDLSGNYSTENPFSATVKRE